MRWPLRGCEGVFRRLLDKLQPAPDKKKHRLVMDPAIGSSVWDRGVVQMYGQAIAAVPAYPVAEPRGKQLHATTRPRAHRFACDAERHITSSHGLTDRRCIPSLRCTWSGSAGRGRLCCEATLPPGPHLGRICRRLHRSSVQQFSPPRCWSIYSSSWGRKRRHVSHP